MKKGNRKKYLQKPSNNQNNKIEFEIENNCDTSQSNHKVGIGLTNLRRRLALAYPKKHYFEVSEIDAIYKAKLNITL